MSTQTLKGYERPFGLRDKIGYLFGDFGNDFTFVLSSGFLMKFYTDVMGVDGFVVGIVMMVARLASFHVPASLNHGFYVWQDR